MNNHIFMEFNKPIFNIGTLGSVSDGKSTMIYQLTGIKTQRHSSEKQKNITIKAGYASLKIWECFECKTSDINKQYYSSSSDINTYNCLSCDSLCKVVNHLSFSDCPGHQELITTMMNTVSLMNGAIVIISASEPLNKKPQLVQHLISAKMANLDKLIICFNKLDLIPKEVAIQRKRDLDDLLDKLNIKPFVIIPTCFNKKLGLNYLLKAIMILYPPENAHFNQDDQPIFRITRSFDINKPGTLWSDIKGGVIGGNLIKGSLKIGDQIEIRPGIINKTKWEPIKTKILTLEMNGQSIDKINTSGLVAIGTEIDPYYCKNDMITGNILGKENLFSQNILNVYTELELTFNKLDILDIEEKWDYKNGDTIFLQIANNNCEARLLKTKNNKMHFQLLKPVCIQSNTKILICRKIDSILKIVGYSII
jgi:translation initiation factor 2 subunit 3